MNTGKFTRLRWGNILGVISSQDEVFSEITKSVEHHSSYWNFGRIRWRWSYDKGIYWFSNEHKPSDEQFALIQSHLTKKYSIKWWDNGFHDLDFLQNKIKKEAT